VPSSTSVAVAATTGCEIPGSLLPHSDSAVHLAALDREVLKGRRRDHGGQRARRGRQLDRADAVAGDDVAAARARARIDLDGRFDVGDRCDVVLGEERLQGRHELRLVLPADALIDVEQARTSMHDAESAIALERWREAWLPARIAWSVGSRIFMAGFEGDWIDERRGELHEVKLRALECIAQVGLRLGGAELPAAERAARSLLELSPYRETGYRLLMEVLEARSNVAEALRVYEDLRCRLRDELGVAPGAETRAAHARLISRA
jgi:Bacterial transcriptional activator domain